MLTNKFCYEISQADVVWQWAFKYTWGSVDEHTCAMCKDLEMPEKHKHIKNNDLDMILDGPENILSPSSKTRMRGGDADMHDAAVEKIDVSWLSGYKHRQVYLHLVNIYFLFI